ncbi:MAG: Gfo/Idh/MocA family protein [Anaerolineae bacterium]
MTTRLPTDTLGVAIIGCGNIAEAYAENLVDYPEIELVGVADLVQARAEALAEAAGCEAYPSVDALLADDRVHLVVNLTTHHAHKAVTERCLRAGKHVHSEKPLALTYSEAQDLVALAEAEGLRLSSSPFTFMGEAQQTAWKLLRDNRIGAVRAIYAEVNWGRIERWHPAPQPFYDVGALYDVGVYPLTLITAIFGPAQRVTAYGRVLLPERETRDGTPFTLTTPDFVIAVIELASGPVIRLTADFYIDGHNTKQHGVEFHGDAGSLYLSSWHNFDADVAVADFGEALAPVPLLRAPYPGVEWGRAVREMAAALREDRPHRATGAQAAHIVEILNAVTQSLESEQPVSIRSTFQPPAPMPWAVSQV